MEDQGSSPSSSTYQLDSPSASTFLRAAETLEELSRKLENIKDETEIDAAIRCCCGMIIGEGEFSCEMGKERQKMEEKLKLSGEIGNALLQRCELLDRRYTLERERYQQQLEVKRTALTESVKRVHNLEKANSTHLQKYAELSRKMETVEKRYAEVMHTQTLTQQSLHHVRSELSTLRDTHARQTVALASRGGVEEKLLEAEKRYEEARDQAAEELRKYKDEKKKVQRAEARIAELEEQQRIAVREVERVKEGRAQDAQDLLINAKERLQQLHNELSETYGTQSPEEAPEYQRILEELVANNTLLKHDSSELSQSLAESRDEIRILRDEVEALRASLGSLRLPSPMDQYPRLAHELNARSSHSRTESSPVVNWTQSRVSAWEHHRKFSSGFAGLGGGTLSAKEGSVVSDEPHSRPVSPIVESPKPRVSPGVSIEYMVNGVPISKPGATNRRFSADSRIIKSYASRTIGSIDETISLPDETPKSPASDYFRAAEYSRKRRSLRLVRHATAPPFHEFQDPSPNASNTLVNQSISSDNTSLKSDSVCQGNGEKEENTKIIKRRTLLLLCKSRGVQTDSITENIQKKKSEHRPSRVETISSRDTSRGHSPVRDSESISSTPNLEDVHASSLLIVVEHLSRILSKLRATDVPTLNKRLKKQHLPGDVMHLSQTTLRALQQEISDIRQQFKAVHNLGVVDARDFNLMLRLMKDVFSDLVELQAVVNDVTVTPSVAKKLHKAAYKTEDDEAVKGTNVASSLGWIAAPITKFFLTPADDPDDHSISLPVPAVAGLERGKADGLPKRTAPKQQAMASATATYVSVEFGGAGMVRRMAPALNTPSLTVPVVKEPELVDPSSQQRMASGPATVGRVEGRLAPPQTGKSLRSVQSKANRNELLGLFAGAAPRVPMPEESWTVVKRKKIESKPVEDCKAEFTTATANKKKLSTAVDAVIDQSAVGNDNDIVIADDYESPLLERQLRPRGLSDSSIRSTTVSSAKEWTHDVVAGVPSIRSPAYGMNPSAPSVFQTLSKKFYSLRTPEVLTDSPSEEFVQTSTSQNSVSHIDPSVITQERPSSSQPIIHSPHAKRKPRALSQNSSISTTTSSSTRETRGAGALTPTSRQTASSPVMATSSQTGFFGYFATSLASVSAEGENIGIEDSQEFVGANLRQGGLLGHVRVDSDEIRRNV
ncbi:hypothetical protein L204_101699 [Cryptococcus depauperatus]